MSHPTPLSPVERFGSLVRLLIEAVVTRNLYFQVIPLAVVGHLVTRLQTLKQRFVRLAARIEAGTYKPRKSFTRKNPENRPKIPGRKAFGWVAAILPQAAPHRGAVLALLQDPEVAKLIAVAPAEVARIIRPVCWMVGVKPVNLPAPPRKATTPPLTLRGQAAKRTDASGRGPRREKPRQHKATPPPAPPPAPGPSPAVPAYQPDYSHHFLGPWYRRTT